MVVVFEVIFVWWRYAEKQLAGQAVFRAAVFVIVLQRSIPGARLREKNENPARSCDRTGKSGDGSSPCSLSRADIRRSPRGGCRLPDAILHGKRSYRPRSRAVQRVTATGLLSEAFKLAWAGGCATGLRTRSRHACDFGSASRPHCPGTATTDGGALAPRDGSRLFTLRLPFVLRPAVRFLHRRRFGRFSRILPRPCVLPEPRAPVVPPFGVFRLANPAFGTARVACSVLAHSSNQVPSG